MKFLFQTCCFAKIGKICKEKMPSLINISRDNGLACYRINLIKIKRGKY